MPPRKKSQSTAQPRTPQYLKIKTQIVPRDCRGTIRVVFPLHGYLIFLVGIVEKVVLDPMSRYSSGCVCLGVQVGAAFCTPVDRRSKEFSYDRGFASADGRARGLDSEHPPFELPLLPGETLAHAFRRALADGSVEWLSVHRVPDRLIEKVVGCPFGTVRTIKTPTTRRRTIVYAMHERQAPRE